jgi:hypothetical protein
MVYHHSVIKKNEMISSEGKMDGTGNHHVK